MQTLSPDDFLRWAKARGIGPHPRYPNSSYLVFTGVAEHGRYWEYPEVAGSVPHFLETLLSSLGDEQRFWLFPGRGYWSLGQAMESWSSTRAWRASIHALGLPRGFVGAVGIDPAEKDVLLAMLFLQVTLGPAIMVDTLVVPESGAAILFFEHHAVVHVTVREESALLKAVGLLEGEGYSLPTEPPDETFKPVSWMGRRDEQEGA